VGAKRDVHWLENLPGTRKMKIEDSVITHFTASVERYTKDILSRDEFALRSLKKYEDHKLRVLELGCGTGHCLEKINTSHPKFKLSGMDITPAMIRLARKLRPEPIIFMVGDCIHSPFEKEEFDVLIMYSVLHHLINENKEKSNALREEALVELVRLMAPDSMIIFEEVMVDTAWRSRLIFSLSRFIARFHISIPILHINTDVVLNFFTPGELMALFDRLDLQMEVQEIKKFKGIGAWISTFGSRTIHGHYLLKRKV
jgi:SAM-dependent methyltransferase